MTQSIEEASSRPSEGRATWTPRIQTAKGLDAIFQPKSIAVIGASDREGSVGDRLMRNILGGGFPGPVYPVNPRAKTIQGRACVARVDQIPGPVDLAVVAVPAASVLDVVEDCGRKGVRGLVIVSAGFRESGIEGEGREARLRDLVRKHQMRMVGPNCIGILNTSPSVRLNATFGNVHPAPGSTALMTQSGALGVALLARANELGLGISQFASMGNKTDVSGNDLLLLWEKDPEVSQVLLYLESFGNPRNFVQIAKRIGRTKPLLAVKAGRSPGGALAAQSHTGALADADRFVDALFDQCGVLRVSTVEELFDDALALSLQPLPQGARVAFVTNSGGPAIMAVDALGAADLVLASLTTDTEERVGAIFPEGIRFGNPLDLLAGATPQRFAAALDAVLGDPHVDAAIAICTPIWGDEDSLAEAIANIVPRHPTKPLLAVLFGQSAGSSGLRRLVQAGVPAYPFPENAVRALGGMRRIRGFRERAEGEHPQIARDRVQARRILDDARSRGGGWLRPDESLTLLETYSVRVARHAFASTAAEAERASRWIDFPLVLKADAQGVVHKSEVGGVALGIRNAEELAAAFDAMKGRVESSGHVFNGVVVMHQEPPGLELLIGATQDPRFGPLMAVGLGGVHAEILKDVQFHLAPLTDMDSKRMVESLLAYPMLRGARGEKPRDIDALERTLIKLSRLAAENPEIVEVEANPFILYPEGQAGLAVDARIRVQDVERTEAKP